MSNATAVPIRPIRRSALLLIVAGIALALLVGGWLAFAGTGQVIADRGTNAQFLAWHKGLPGVVETASGLQYQVLKQGTGPHPTDSDVALISYKGTLRDGTPFDANERVPMPVSGSIKGFSEALKLMSKGAEYRVWIKPELGYGEQSPDPSKIPNGALLVFDVTLVDFLPQQIVQQMQMQQMMRQQQQQGGMGTGGATPGGMPPQGMPPQ